MTSRRAKRAALGLAAVAVLGVGCWLIYDHLAMRRHLSAAEDALKKNRYSDALASYEDALAHRPDSADLHLLAGRTARRAGLVDEARGHFDRCRELQGGVSEELQLEQYMLRAQTGELDEVYPALAPYLAEDGDYTPLILEALTRTYIETYQLGRAWDALSRWQKLQPDNPEMLFRLGLWHSLRSDDDEAISLYTKVIEIDPRRTDARLALATLLRTELRSSDAAEQYRAVLGDEPDNPHALLGLAQCAADTGQTAEARELLERLPPESRAKAAAQRTQGLVEMQSQNHAEAADHFRRALDEEPWHKDACYNLMRCLKILGRDGEAERWKQKLREIESDQKRLIFIIGEGLTESPDDPALPYELGDIYLRFGLPRRGVRWLHQALEIDPSYRPAHERLRDHFDGLGAEGKERADFHREALNGLR